MAKHSHQLLLQVPNPASIAFHLEQLPLNPILQFHTRVLQDRTCRPRLPATANHQCQLNTKSQTSVTLSQS